MAEICIKKKNLDLNRISPWTLSSFFFARLKTIIESVWTTLVDPFEDIELIFNALKDHKSSRISQYFQFHFANFIAINNASDA
jgi:hypothetical protein